MTAGLKRAFWTAALSLLVVGSLLVFPAAVPWMIAVWLAWHTASVARGRGGWLPLACCVVVLLVKRVVWTPCIGLLGLLLLTAGFVGATSLRKVVATQKIPIPRVLLIILWTAWAMAAFEWHTAARCGRLIKFEPARPVVCIGDSLTAGLPPYGGYPRVLQQMLSVGVINLGQDGITSADALEKMPALVAANPQAVVVELGGHDFLKGYSRASTLANLRRIVDTCRGIGAEVVLMEVPRGFITDPYDAPERELARLEDLELIADGAIRNLVLWSPHGPLGAWSEPAWHLSDDGLHPNVKGNRYLAKRVAAALERVYGPKIRLAGKSQERPVTYLD